MLAADRTMLHGSLKNTLMDILEKLDTGRDIEGYSTEGFHASSYRDNSLHRRVVLKNWIGLRIVPMHLVDYFTIYCFTVQIIFQVSQSQF